MERSYVRYRVAFGRRGEPAVRRQHQVPEPLCAEEFGATIEAFTYPAEFAQCDGSLIAFGGVTVGQQSRKTFGLSYRTLLGNDLLGRDFGYKVHLIYGALAAPSEKAYSTVNDSPEATTFSWELTTSAVAIGTVNSVAYKPAAYMTIDSTKVTPANLAALEDALLGTAGTDPRLPLPAEVIGMFNGSLTVVSSITAPTATTAGVITIPAVTGIDFRIDGNIIPTGTFQILPNTIGAKETVTATPKALYTIAPDTLSTWVFTKTT